VGGDVLAFADLADHLAPGQPFYGLRAGTGDGEDQPCARIEDMAAHYLEAIRAVQPAGPYYLAGFSFGGSVALEMAQQLCAHGEGVAFLGILDHTPPPTRYRRPAWTPAAAVDFLRNVPRWLAEDLWRAGRGHRLAALGRKAKAAGRLIGGLVSRRGPGSGEADAAEVVGGRPVAEPFRRLLADHYQALRDYVPRVYPGTVTLFRARTRPLFRLHEHDLGWGRLAGGGLKVVPVPGNHETMLKEPHVRVLAGALMTHLRGARHGWRVISLGTRRSSRRPGNMRPRGPF
jgi:thioesterase domain-containing protein